MSAGSGSNSFVTRHGIWGDEQHRKAHALVQRLHAAGNKTGDKTGDIDTVRFAFADQHGMVRGKTLVTPTDLTRAIRADGVGTILDGMAVSVAVGMIPLISSRFFQYFPKDMAPLTHSGIVLAALMALVLNLMFNGYQRQTPTPNRVAAHPQT